MPESLRRRRTLTPRQQRVMDLLADGEWHRAAEAARMLGVSSNTASGILQTLVEGGRILRRRLLDDSPRRFVPGAVNVYRLRRPGEARAEAKRGAERVRDSGPLKPQVPWMGYWRGTPDNPDILDLLHLRGFE